MYRFEEVLRDISRSVKRIPQTQFLDSGAFPVIDQGQQAVAGYCNEADGLCNSIPAIVFGDHTRCVKYLEEPFAAGADGVKVLAPVRRGDNPKYLFYALCAADIPSLGYSRHFKLVKELRFVVPARAVQDKIVSQLDSIEQHRLLLTKRLGRLNDLVKSEFVEMFGSDCSGQLYALKDCCDFIDYRGKTPQKVEDGIPLITAKNVKDGYFSPEPREYMEPADYDKWMTRGFPQPGDILFTTEAPLGNVCRIPSIEGRFALAQRVITIQPDQSRLDNEYVAMALRSEGFQREVMRNSTGSTAKGIKSKLLIEIGIPIPPLTFQQEFAAFVQQVDKSKFAVQQAIAKLELLKAALMQEYFG